MADLSIPTDAFFSNFLSPFVGSDNYTIAQIVEAIQDAPAWNRRSG
jgi:hypothetical protein